jgi:hypothetical protein
VSILLSAITLPSQNETSGSLAQKHPWCARLISATFYANSNLKAGYEF